MGWRGPPGPQADCLVKREKNEDEDPTLTTCLCGPCNPMANDRNYLQTCRSNKLSIPYEIKKKKLCCRVGAERPTLLPASKQTTTGTAANGDGNASSKRLPSTPNFTHPNAPYPPTNLFKNTLPRRYHMALTETWGSDRPKCLSSLLPPPPSPFRYARRPVYPPPISQLRLVKLEGYKAERVRES